MLSREIPEQIANSEAADETGSSARQGTFCSHCDLIHPPQRAVGAVDTSNTGGVGSSAGAKSGQSCAICLRGLLAVGGMELNAETDMTVDGSHMVSCGI